MTTAINEGFPPVRSEARPDLVLPGSPAHYVLADALLPLYGLPGFLLPLMHPATADATLNRDPVFTNPDAHLFHFAARLRDTFEMIAGVCLAGAESEHVGFAMRELHKQVKGHDADGQAYHAWSRDIWTWNWAAIVAGYMTMYDRLRGFPTASFRDDAYLGLVETGRRFGVLGMPESYDDFLQIWPRERDRIGDPGNETIRRVVALTTAAGLPAPRSLRWLPLPVWAALTMPARNAMRVSLIFALSPEERAGMGIPERLSDRMWARLHLAAWRLLPRSASYRVGLAWIQARSRYGTPVWRTRYSAQTLGKQEPSS